ncbi:hypothetical protein [Paraburkholderia panacisoli]|uniref:hypothetical protein n=1 Tax=Paraburkholderia panacisoli TaxID=2603818 RepID=UPI003CCC6E06
MAWSGAAQIARVEISMGEGSWQEAHLVSPRYFLIDPRMGIFVQSRSCRPRYADAGHKRP